MRQVSGIEYELTLPEDLFGVTIVDHGRCEHADTGVAVFIVVPREKKLRMDAAVLD